MGRSLLDAPLPWLAAQARQDALRIPAFTPAVERLRAAGIQPEPLVAALDEAARRGFAAELARRTASADVLRARSEVRAWLAEVRRFTRELRDRLALLEDPAVTPAASALRAALPRSVVGHRHEGSLRHLEAALPLIDAVLPPAFGARARALRATGVALAESTARAVAARAAAVAEAEAAEDAVRVVLRRVRLAWALAVRDHPALALPDDQLLEAAARRRPRARRASTPEPAPDAPAPSPAVSALHPIDAETPPVDGATALVEAAAALATAAAQLSDLATRLRTP